jgi:hypothetical protein
MAVQTMNGRDTIGYCDLDFCSGAVMTGGAGTVAVGWNIVFNPLYFRPVGHNMTVAAKLARRVIGKVVGAYFHLMCTCTMRCRAVLMAGITGLVRPDSEHFRPNNIRTSCIEFVVLIMT